jgi:hypothetical protein
MSNAISTMMAQGGIVDSHRLNGVNSWPGSPGYDLRVQASEARSEK